MTTARGPAGASAARRRAVLAFAAVVFVSLTIAGLGLVSLFQDADVIEVPGLGPIPGVVGVVVALVGWALVTARLLRLRAGVAWALLAGLVAGACYPLAVLVATLFAGADPSDAAGIAGRLIVLGFAPVVAVAGLLSATGAAVAVRTGDQTPRWPWERDDEE